MDVFTHCRKTWNYHYCRLPHLRHCHQQDNHHNQCNRCQSFIQPFTHDCPGGPGGGCRGGDTPPPPEMICGFLTQLVFSIKVCLRHQQLRHSLVKHLLQRKILDPPVTVHQTAPKSGQNKNLETTRICSETSARIKVQLGTFTP